MRDGILLVDKPGGPTSADVVRQIKRRFRVAAIGHVGTLDPMATGLLPLCLGAGTKIAQFLAADHKAYTGEIRLGLATDTLDVTGITVAEAEVPAFDDAALERVAADFLGPGEQRPPMYSAVKIAGRELYKLAREGVEVERSPRPVEIRAFRLEQVPGNPLAIRFAVDCSKGTYVRVLAADVGAALGTLATLASLRRTRFGAFDVAEARPLQELLDLPGIEDLPLIPSRAALRGVREMPVDPPLAFAIASGQRTALREVSPPLDDERLLALIAPNRELLAVLEADSGSWRLKRVLMPEAGQLYRP